jgi:hypothetical protein
MFFLGLSSRGAFVFAERLRCVISGLIRVIDSSLLMLMVLRVREHGSAYRLFFSISDDDMYHANSD